MRIGRTIQALVASRPRFVPQHDEPRCYSPMVQAFLMGRGIVPVAAEEIQNER